MAGTSSDYYVHDSEEFDGSIAKRMIEGRMLLSADEIADDASIGDVLGTASINAAFVGTPIWSLLNDGGGQFDINESTGVVRVISALTSGTTSVRIKVKGTKPPIQAGTFVVTITESEGGGTPEWLPDGAITFLDFVNGHYYAGGEEITAEDAVTLSGVATIELGEGLYNYDEEAPEGTTGVLVPIIGAALTSLLTLNWTIVLDAEVLTYSLALFGLADGDDSNELVISGAIIGETSSDSERHFQIYDYGTSEYRELNSSGTFLVGEQHKLAVTRTDSKLSLAFDGNSAVTSAAVGSLVVNTATIGGSPFAAPANGAYVLKTLTLYPPIDDSLLPGLSAL